MDYEKKYREAVKKAEAFYYSATTEPITEREVLANIFPELQESEDERIRKTLIEYFNAYPKDYYAELKRSHILAWLEKQGEQKNFDYENANIQQKDFAPKFAMEAIKKEKVEPKFKVGDWVVSNLDKKARQISEVHFDEYNSYYVVNGQSVNLEEYDRLHHLWTIEDAKPGDVLVDVYGNIGIFEKRYGYNWHTYSYLGYEGSLVSEGGSHGSICYPATKEQRDTFFAKMHEAGYEWDAEKLELIKVPKLKEPEGALKHLLDEQEKLYKEAEIILENKDTALAFLKRTGIIDENGELSEKYRSEQTLATTISVGNGINSTAITDGNTSVTSEEVERQYCTEQYEPDVRDFPIEWSEEDERNLQGVIDEIEANKSNAPDYDAATYDRFLSWLKSLKERYTWKPSDEQIELLEALVEDNNQRYFYTTLNSLYEQLKKLREG